MICKLSAMGVRWFHIEQEDCPMAQDSKFSQRHYEVIARTLKEANADIPMVEAFVEVLEQDNPRFKPDRFRQASV